MRWSRRARPRRRRSGTILFPQRAGSAGPGEEPEGDRAPFVADVVAELGVRRCDLRSNGERLRQSRLRCGRHPFLPASLRACARPGDPRYDEIEMALAAQPQIAVPAITIDGDADGVNPGTAHHAKRFTGRTSIAYSGAPATTCLRSGRRNGRGRSSTRGRWRTPRGYQPLPSRGRDAGLAIPDFPGVGQDERPDRSKLADVLGPGLITCASDDDPSGVAAVGVFATWNGRARALERSTPSQ